MINIIAAFIYCIVGFVMWLSLVFTGISKLAGEKNIFSNLLRAILVYISGFIISIIMTALSYATIYYIQRIL